MRQLKMLKGPRSHILYTHTHTHTHTHTQLVFAEQKNTFHPEITSPCHPCVCGDLVRHPEATPSCHCERSVPQATPTGGPVRDERSEHAISDGLPRAHALAKTEAGLSVFSSCHPCAGGDLPDCHSCQGERERESMPRQARHDTIMLPCHCERSDAISDRLPRAHALAMTEVGRSMVEMLGVLAIMGIVGMVGVKMYNMAMNKHKANELIYEAQKRATMVAMQITAGQENLSISNFTNPTGYVFGVEKNPLNSNQFNITMTGVDSDVCTQMKTAVGPATPIRVISEYCDKLTFNNDLSTKGYTTDFDTNKNGCENAGYTWCAKGDNVVVSKCSGTNDCCEGVIYDAQCQSCNSVTGEITNQSTSCTYTYADETTASSTCNAGICLDPAITTSTKCLTNADCGGTGSGYYCSYSISDASKICATDAVTAIGCTGQTASACENAGTCTKIGTVTKAKVEGLGYVIVSPSGRWWSTKNWCESQGKHLIEFSKFGCFKSGTTDSDIKLNAGGTDETPCCASGKTCTKWSIGEAAAMWNGNTLTEARAGDGELFRVKYSSVILDLRKQFPTGMFWTATKYHPNACNAFYLRSIEGVVRGPARWYDNRPALCQ